MGVEVVQWVICWLCFWTHLPESGSPTPQLLTSLEQSQADRDGERISHDNQVEFTQEMMPKEAMVKLPSKDDGKTAKRPLFVIHAIEGVVAPLRAIASELNCPVWGLQCVADAPLDSIGDLARFYISKLKTVQAKGPYVVAGYSFGAAVAFEMVAQLEAAGEKCQLIMLDGSPQYLSWYTESQSKKTAITVSGSPAQAEAYCLGYFALVAGNLHYTTVAKQLEILHSLDERLSAVAEMVAKETKHDVALVSERVWVETLESFVLMRLFYLNLMLHRLG